MAEGLKTAEQVLALEEFREGATVEEVAEAAGWSVLMVSALVSGRAGWEVHQGRLRRVEAGQPARLPEPVEPVEPGDFLEAALASLGMVAHAFEDERVRAACDRAAEAVEAVRGELEEAERRAEAAQKVEWLKAEVVAAEAALARARAELEAATGIASAAAGEASGYVPPDAQERADIRAWAAGAGIKVGTSGRVAAAVVQQYREAKRAAAERSAGAA